MSIDHEKRCRTVGLSVRKQTWELETLKQRNRAAADALRVADEVLRCTESEIAQTENALCRAMNGELTFDIAAIQATQVYLAEQHEQYRAHESERRRAQQRAEQAEQQLRYASLTIKALERVQQKSQQIISREQEKRLLEENVELWIQQARRET